MTVRREDGDGAIVRHGYVLTVVSRSSQSVASVFKSGARERRAMRVVPSCLSRVIMRRGGGGTQASHCGERSTAFASSSTSFRELSRYSTVQYKLQLLSCVCETHADGRARVYGTCGWLIKPRTCAESLVAGRLLLADSHFGPRCLRFWGGCCVQPSHRRE